MSDRDRRDRKREDVTAGAATLLRLRGALALRAAAGGVLLGAYRVRAGVREAGELLRGVSLLLWLAPSRPRLLIAYLRPAPGDGPVGHSLTAGEAPAGAAGGDDEDRSSGRRGRQRFRRRIPAPAEGTLLRDERVRRLQEDIVTLVFRRRLGVAAGARERAVLGRFSSVGWLVRTLARAAGYGAAPPRHAEARYRMQILLPVVVRALELHARYLELASPLQSMGGAGAGKLRREALLRNLYPREVAAERLRHRLQTMDRDFESRRFSVRTREELRRLNRHTDAIMILSRHTALQARGRRLERLMAREMRRQGGGHGRMDG